MNENQTPVVTTEALTKRYGERVAVDRVSMTVRRGEVYGFLGPNGAGKTTTLRMMLGLVRPTAGAASIATDRVGALIEGPGFHPYLSGRDNLRTLARFRGLAVAEVERVLERVDLAGRATGLLGLAFRARLGGRLTLYADAVDRIHEQSIEASSITGVTDPLQHDVTISAGLSFPLGR